MKYYVNQFYGDRLGGEAAGFPNVYPGMYIGLFTACEAKGEGNFCGYYGAEYYLNTELLAYYVAEGGRYQPEKRISEVQSCYFRRQKILIGSHMWTLVIEAETLEEALEKFENAEWRRWELEDAGITVQTAIEAINAHRYKHVGVYIKCDNGIYYYEDEDIYAIDESLLSQTIKDQSCMYQNGNYTVHIRV